MSSGNKSIIINNQERAVSLDINRAQAFIGTDIAQVMRFLIDARTTEDNANGVATVGAAPVAPMRGEILNGLCVKPEVGGTNMFVDPGVAVLVSPDASPSADDIALKVIIDTGVTTVGALTMASNVSGQPRVDVVECAVLADQVLESDSRDIFNNGTGLFSATTVPKVSQSVLQYRVRNGTPGAGLPAHQTGWLPLMVLVVPSGAASLNDCWMWDVRPMWFDRNGVGAESAFTPVQSRSVELRQPVAQTTTPYTQPINIQGNVELALNGRRLGGNLSPGSGTPYVNLNDGNHLDPAYYAQLGFGLTMPFLSQCFYVWLCTPLGLPRWALYSASTSGARVPQTPRGILVMSIIGTDGQGNPNLSFALPTALGLGAVTIPAGPGQAKLAYAGVLAGSPLQPMEGRMDGDTAEHIGVEWSGVAPASSTLTDYMPNMYGSLTGQDGPKTKIGGLFTLVDGVTHPANATHVTLRFGLNALKASVQPGASAIQTLITLADQSGSVYWKKALTDPSKRDAPWNTFGEFFFQNYSFVWNLSTAPTGETITGINHSTHPISVTGTQVLDHLSWSFNAFAQAASGSPGSSSVVCEVYVQENGATIYTTGAIMALISYSGDTDTLAGQISIAGTHTVAAAGNLTVNFRTIDGTPYGAPDNSGIVLSSGALDVELRHFTPSPTPPANTLDTPYFFTLEDVPLRRGAGPQHNLNVVIDGRPFIDVNPALPSNPYLGADHFAMDVIGWKLGS